MAQPIIYLAVTGHGFGHAVRVACVANQVQKLCPEALLILATRSPRWLLEGYIAGDFIHRSCVLDVGVIQADSLRMDREATQAKMTEIYAHQSRLIANEVNYLRNNRVNLVLADIPALAVPIAHQAGVPCWMMSNFGWNFIYREWGESFEEIVNQIERDYQQCDRLFRLPLAEPMSIFPVKTEVGLTGGDPRYPAQVLREKFHLTQPQEKTILLTFGGLGLQAIPYQNLDCFPDYQFITFDGQAPDLPNLVKVQDYHYRPVDFMPLCDRVFSKPGYSTFAEALRLEIPLVSLTRDGFAEAAILLDGLQDYGYHQIVPEADFFNGAWEFLRESPLPPRQAQTLTKNGAEAIAQAILEQIATQN